MCFTSARQYVPHTVIYLALEHMVPYLATKTSSQSCLLCLSLREEAAGAIRGQGLHGDRTSVSGSIQSWAPWWEGTEQDATGAPRVAAGTLGAQVPGIS